MHRPHGLTTAFVGSSNLSYPAMHAGLEWNVRLAEAEAASVIERMRANVYTYWDDDAFEEYSPLVMRSDLSTHSGASGRAKRRTSRARASAGLT